MKKNLRTLLMLFLVLCFCVGLAACALPQVSEQTTNGADTQGNATGKNASTTEQPTLITLDRDYYVEWWRTNQAGITWEKDGPMSQWLVEKTGVGMYSPLVMWEGGKNYSNKLQTRAATGDLPDIFMPRDGVEKVLIEDGLIWDISEYLEVYAPNVWKAIPERIWNVVRTNDPTGNGGIYYIPNVQLYNGFASFMRKDWLDEAGLGIPTTQDEYVNALRAFKARGEDILPTIGREFGRWMDHLFFMYDVAMYEGYPCFDIYNGEVTYSAVTPNMKEAIAFIRSLYEERLLDNETFLNKSGDLWEKVKTDRVGSWYHIPYGLDGMALIDLLKTNSKAEVVVLPRIAAPGYDGYITIREVWGPYWAFGKKDEETLVASLKLLDWLADPANKEDLQYGIEGLHHNVVNGKKEKIYDYDVNVVEKLVGFGAVSSVEDQIVPKQQTIDDPTAAEYLKNASRQSIAAVDAAQVNRSRPMVDDGIPSTVYDGFPDIASRKLYQEYMTKIIIGDLPIDAFDEFVEKWYETGGEEVTKRIREWYSSTGK